MRHPHNIPSTGQLHELIREWSPSRDDGDMASRSEQELLYAYLDATQRNLMRAEARAESLRQERMSIVHMLTTLGEPVADVAARLGMSRGRLYKLIQDNPAPTKTDPKEHDR